MKKLLLALIGAIVVSGMIVSMAFAESEPAEPIVLPMQDDHGQHWVLQNENATYRVKWSISEESPFEHFDGLKIDDQTVILRNFSEVFAVNPDGKVLWKLGDYARQLDLGADGNLVAFKNDFSFNDEQRTTSQAMITRVDRSGKILSQYKKLSLALVRQEGTFWADMFYTVDWKGNLITLTDKGLISLRPDGSVKWQANELQVNDKTYNVFEMNALEADSEGHLLVGVDDQLLCLTDDGNVKWSTTNPSPESRLKLSGKYVLLGDSIYTITAKGLTDAKSPELALSLSNEPIDHQGGYYRVNFKTSTLTNIDSKSGNTAWSYTLAQSEREAGYGLSGNFDQNFVSDSQGNVYVSTNGGTIHSLDPEGNSRFTLQMTNKIMSYSQIIPFTKNTIVIINNQHVICLERVDDAPGMISLTLNGNEQALKNKPMMQDGRVMVSVREIFELLGANVNWDGDHSIITAEKKDKKIVMQLGSTAATVNGTAMTFDAAPSLVGDVTYVPVRYVSEALGNEVVWDDAEQVVRIIDASIGAK